MARTTIDRETVQRIIDTANIVEVVSDFVHLRRRGANYVGLCPFHSERTPSFSVSPSKGLCKCFSCGKGGSVIGFLMEHEQLTYVEALRWLAKKYHIEIEEHELTDDERREMNDRQAMMAVNDFALAHFEKNLTDTADGRDIGLSYFRGRGINDWAIKRFHLGYSLDRRDDLFRAALDAGHKEKYLVDTGLCIHTDKGSYYDRFKARVMFPVFTISGKVVAFGGRTLRKDKEVAKYVNSPESIIYSKSRELYGLYQAKQAIVKKDRCILVEGYMDVISMHQRGVENVVASSGTSLTQGQIRLIHRFTENVTVIYDSDAAGIKASLRGIDLLLAEGLNIKVLLLPDGDDPDSFAQSHTAEEVDRYIYENEVDFIKFKMNILLADCSDDPIKRSKVLASILKSIANIPDEITRSIYIKECAIRFEIEEAVMLRQVNVEIASMKESNARQARRDSAIKCIDNPPVPPEIAQESENADTGSRDSTENPGVRQAVSSPEDLPHATTLAPQERALLQIVLRYGLLPLGDDFSTDGKPISVIDFIKEDLEIDDVRFASAIFRRVFEEALRLRNETWPDDYATAQEEALLKYNQTLEEGREQIKRDASTTEEINRLESSLAMRCKEQYDADLMDFSLNYFTRHLSSHPDDAVRASASNLVIEKHILSKIYTKGTKIVTDAERLDDLVPRALCALKYDNFRCKAEDCRIRIAELQKQPDYDIEEVLRLMARQKELQEFCSHLASHIGERVYEPLRQ